MINNRWLKSSAIALVLACNALLFSGTSLAASPTPQQIEQFKKLPRAQQEALARQYGIALPTDSSSSSAQASALPQSSAPEAIAAPVAVDQPTEKLTDTEVSSQLQPFGYDLFASSPSTFAPLVYSPVPANYLIGPGDTLRVTLFGKEQAEYELAVNHEGDLVLPGLGPLNVAGLTFTEVKAIIADRVSRQMIGVQVNVTMGQLRALQVFVLGEVGKPGTYSISALSTITHALFAAGGISKIGSLRNVQLKRSGELVAVLDLYDLLIKGDTSNDLLLQPGDSVFVPVVEQTAAISGAVRRPAIYELAGGESMKDLVALAGGLLPGAYGKQLFLERIDNASRKSVQTINLTRNKDAALGVRHGDFLRVKEMSGRVDDAVTLLGAVVRPGRIEWREGMRLSELLNSASADLLAEADMDYALVVRETNVRGDIEVLQFALGAVLAGEASANLALRPRDRVMVFSQYEERALDINELDEMAYSAEELGAMRKQRLAKRQEENSIWRDMATELSETANLDEGSDVLKSNESLYRELAATRSFSRARLLFPVIRQLRDQGKRGQPVQLAEVDGEVRYPGLYPIPVNGRVRDLIAAAGGIKESAFTSKAELSRHRIKADQTAEIEHLSVNLGDAMAGVADANLLLSSKDRLNVNAYPFYSENWSVRLVGEVKFPGTYSIRRGETLRDVLHRASGFTPNAHLDAAVFSRISIQRQEEQYIARTTQEMRAELAAASMRTTAGAGQLADYSQLSQILNELNNVKPLGRLVVELDQVMAGNQTYDIALENGDVLYVPAFRNTVAVVGQVQMPSTHMYKPGLELDDYLAMSGGAKRQADDDRTYVLKANGAVRMLSGGNWLSSGDDDSALQPGDTIVVPMNVEYRDNLTLWTNVTQILYNTGVAVAAIAAVI